MRVILTLAGLTSLLSNPALAADQRPPVLSAMTYGDIEADRFAPPAARSNSILTHAPTTARGIVRAGERLDLSAPLSLRLSKAPFRAGHQVKKGQELARFDCTRLRADLNAKDKAIETLDLRYQSEAELASFGASGEYDVAVARSERDQAQAEAGALRTSLKDCIIRAPFAAHIQARHVAPYETPAIGAPIYSLIRAGDHEISIIVPIKVAHTLDIGSKFSFQLDMDTPPFTVRVTRLAPDIDPVSQTLEVIAKPASTVKLRPGMSGEALFSTAPPKTAAGQ